MTTTALPGLPAAAASVRLIASDLDGTLLDSNYQHAIAWFRTFQERGRTFAMVELHRLIGMGGDQLVEAIAGKDFDAEHGDECRNAEPLRYREIAGDGLARRYVPAIAAGVPLKRRRTLDPLTGQNHAPRARRRGEHPHVPGHLRSHTDAERLTLPRGVR